MHTKRKSATNGGTVCLGEHSYTCVALAGL